MSGGELAVVLASVAVVVAVAVLGAVGVSLTRALRELRHLLSEIRRDLLPAVRRIEEASGQVTGEVQRVGGLLDVAERVSERAETLSSATSRALLEPLNAVASLFRRSAPAEPDAGSGAGQVVSGWGGVAAAAPPRRARRGSWPRRMTGQLLRSAYRSASTRLAASQAQRATGGATRPARGGAAAKPTERVSGSAAPAAGTSRKARDPAGSTASGAAGLPLGRQLLEAVREVSNEISATLREGREALRADRRVEEPPK